MASRISSINVIVKKTCFLWLCDLHFYQPKQVLQTCVVFVWRTYSTIRDQHFEKKTCISVVNVFVLLIWTSLCFSYFCPSCCTCNDCHAPLVIFVCYFFLMFCYCNRFVDSTIKKMVVCTTKNQPTFGNGIFIESKLGIPIILMVGLTSRVEIGRKKHPWI